MISQRSVLPAFFLSAVLGALASPSSALAQNTVIHLNYGAGQTCNFLTQGISISGTNASSIETQPNGQFDFVNSDCPTGGGNTGVASVVLSATPAVIDENQPSHITWTATADVCRYDGSVLPGAVAGWQTSGYACIGSDACASGGNINQVFTVSGTYNFKLTCLSGAYSGQPQTQISKSATVQVNGTTPPNPTCVAPQGLTQQTTGTLADMAGYPVHSDVDVTDWLDVFGFTWQTFPPTYYGWPGIAASGTKLYINKNQYVSLHFTVPSDYTLTNPTTSNPRGSFKTNASAVTNGVHWAVSITPDCGDFNQPAYGQPGNKCYAEYSTSQGDTLVWVVTNPNTPISGFCNLNPGESYYLNIVAAPLSNPTQSNCPSSVCKVNFQQSGTISSGPPLQ